MPKALLPHTQRKWVRTLVRTGGGNRTPRFVRRARAPSINLRRSQIADSQYSFVVHPAWRLGVSRGCPPRGTPAARRGRRPAPIRARGRRCAAAKARTQRAKPRVYGPHSKANEESRVFRFRRGFHNVSNCQLPPRLPRGAALSGIYRGCAILGFSMVTCGCVLGRGGWARFLGCLPREPRALWGAGLGQAADLKCQIYCQDC